MLLDLSNNVIESSRSVSQVYYISRKFSITAFFSISNERMFCIFRKKPHFYLLNLKEDLTQL
jgi:hypothetical protein